MYHKYFKMSSVEVWIQCGKFLLATSIFIAKECYWKRGLVLRQWSTCGQRPHATIITCLPKPGKQSVLTCHWRPLSMLSVIYKLASAAIANRIKPHLNLLISDEQTGFVPNRFIGESTRLVYDLMDYSEKKQIPGLLVLIDFQKVFDSISLNFIYKTLTFSVFTNDFIRWIKLFNTDIEATILQSGFTSIFLA